MVDTRHTHYQHASGTPDTVLSYDATGAPELLAKSSLGGTFDIDTLPSLGVPLVGTELLAVSQGGTESQVDINTLGTFLGISGGGGGGGALINIQSFAAQGSYTYTATAGTDYVVVYATAGGGGGGGSFIGDTGGVGGNTTFDGPSTANKLLCVGGSGGIPSTGLGSGSTGGAGGSGSIAVGLAGFGINGGSGTPGFSESNTGTNNGYAQGGTGGSSLWGGGGAANGGSPETGRAFGSGGGGFALTAVSPTDNISGGGGGAGGSAIVRLDSDFDGGTVTVGAGGSGSAGANGRNGIVTIFEYSDGALDIDSLPPITTAVGTDTVVISDGGTESSMTLDNLVTTLAGLGLGGGGGGLLNVQTFIDFITPQTYTATPGTNSILVIATGGGGSSASSTAQIAGTSSDFDAGVAGSVLGSGGQPGSGRSGGQGGTGSGGFLTVRGDVGGWAEQAGTLPQTPLNFAYSGLGGSSFWGGTRSSTGNTIGAGGGGTTDASNVAYGGGGGGGTAMGFFDSGFDGATVTVGAGGNNGNAGAGFRGEVVVFEFG